MNILTIYSERAFKSLQNISKAKKFKMPKFISLETETNVKQIPKENYSNFAIKKKLEVEIIDISVKTTTRILKNVGIRRQAFSKKNQYQSSTVRLLSEHLNY